MVDTVAWSSCRTAGVGAVRVDETTVVVAGRDAIDAVLADPACSSRGASLFTGLPLMPPLELDGVEHLRWRRAAARVLAGQRGSYRDALACATELVAGLDVSVDGHVDGLDLAGRFVADRFAAVVDGPDPAGRWRAWAAKLASAGTDPRRSFEVAAAIAVDFERSRTTGVPTRPQRIVADMVPEATARDYASFALMLLYAGVASTASAVASVLWHAARHDGILDAVALGRLEPAAVADEVIRLYAPVSTARTATASTTVAGVDVEPGDLLVVSFPAASRECQAADRFDPTGSDLSFAFGRGVHRCLGVEFARVHVAAFVEAFAASVVRVECVAEPSWTSGTVRRPDRLTLAVVRRSAS